MYRFVVSQVIPRDHWKTEYTWPSQNTSETKTSHKDVRGTDDTHRMIRTGYRREEIQMKNIVVTGTSSGFGFGTTLELIRRGYRVFATMRDVQGRNAAAAQDLRARAAELAGEIDIVQMDVTDDVSVNHATREIYERETRIDGLVHSAGIAAGGFTETFTPSDLQRLYEVNVVGIHRVSRAFLPGFRKQKHGLICVVSSTLGREVTPFLAPYVATKFALQGFWEAFRYELHPHGIDTVMIQPGTFPTTKIVPNLLQPSDPERAAGYPELASTLDGFFQGLGAYADSGHAPDPLLVAEAISDVVEMAGGTRPHQIVVDPNGPGGAKALNEHADQVQKNVLQALQLSQLMPSTGAGTKQKA